MTCNVCGREIRDDATKCPYCFASVTPKTSTAAKNPYNVGVAAKDTSKKFCSNCGKQIPSSATKCPYCLRSTSSSKPTYSTGESKVALGVIFCLFLGWIGLIIGLCMYSSGSTERSTFLKGWWTTFFVALAICFIIILVFFKELAPYLDSYNIYY